MDIVTSARTLQYYASKDLHAMSICKTYACSARHAEQEVLEFDSWYQHSREHIDSFNRTPPMESNPTASMPIVVYHWPWFTI
jgi:hypothetical protein